jgi:hypothetical protein
MTTRRNLRTTRQAATLVTLTAMLLALAPAATAVPYLESAYGGQSPWLSAEINGLGGTGGAVYRCGLSTRLNPAGLAAADAWRVDVGLGVAYHEEERFAPVYDSFGSYVVDASIASNQNTWPTTGFAVAGRVELGDVPLGIGIALADRNPWDYEFSEEIRDPDFNSSPRDRILEERTYEVDGALRTLSFGVGGEASGVALGAAVHYAFGDRDQSVWVRDNDPDEGDQSYQADERWNLSGVNATFGLQVRPNERLALAVAYETALTVDGDLDSELYLAENDSLVTARSAHSLEYPAAWRLGAAIYPRHDPRTVLTVDVVLTSWTDLEDDRPDLDQNRLTDPAYLQDVVDVRIGLQHQFQGGQTMNVGFRRYDSYNDADGGNSIFSAGSGWPIGPGRLAVSLELNKLQTWDVPHIFAYPDGYDAPDDARVDDLRLRLGLGWSHEF